MKPHRPIQSASAIRKPTRLCGKAAVISTMAMAPIAVPIMRKPPLRNEAPRLGWQTIAAEVAAQYGASSSSLKATNSVRHTDAQSRTP